MEGALASISMDLVREPLTATTGTSAIGVTVCLPLSWEQAALLMMTVEEKLSATILPPMRLMEFVRLFFPWTMTKLQFPRTPMGITVSSGL